MLLSLPRSSLSLSLLLTGAFASVIVENSFKLATNLRKEHHDECRKSFRAISLRNISVPPLNDDDDHDNNLDVGDEEDHRIRMSIDHRSNVLATTRSSSSSSSSSSSTLYGAMAPRGNIAPQQQSFDCHNIVVLPLSSYFTLLPLPPSYYHHYRLFFSRQY